MLLPSLYIVWHDLPANSPANYPANNHISWIWKCKKIELKSTMSTDNETPNGLGSAPRYQKEQFKNIFGLVVRASDSVNFSRKIGA